MISELIKSQKGNVIFVILTPAQDCCVTLSFYTHHSQLYTAKQPRARLTLPSEEQPRQFTEKERGGERSSRLLYPLSEGKDVLCANICRHG